MGEIGAAPGIVEAALVKPRQATQVERPDGLDAHGCLLGREHGSGPEGLGTRRRDWRGGGTRIGRAQIEGRRLLPGCGCSPFASRRAARRATQRASGSALSITTGRLSGSAAGPGRRRADQAQRSGRSAAAARLRGRHRWRRARLVTAIEGLA